MSELRDVTQALRAVCVRLASVEDCLVTLVRDSQQQAEWRHKQKNLAVIDEGIHREQDVALGQIQEFCAATSHKVAELVDRLDQQGKTRLDDVKALHARITALEPEEETTKP